MRQAPDRQPRPEHGLAVPIATALVLKLAALTALYLAFFATPMRHQNPDRAATAIFGLPAQR
jgi:hypothetical protein